MHIRMPRPCRSWGAAHTHPTMLHRTGCCITHQRLEITLPAIRERPHQKHATLPRGDWSDQAERAGRSAGGGVLERMPTHRMMEGWKHAPTPVTVRGVVTRRHPFRPTTTYMRHSLPPTRIYLLCCCARTRALLLGDNACVCAPSPLTDRWATLADSSYKYCACHLHPTHLPPLSPGTTIPEPRRHHP